MSSCNQEQLSQSASALLEFLPADGSRKNQAWLSERLGLDQHALDTATEELRRGGLAVADGKRLARKLEVGAAADCEQSREARELLNALPADGSRLSNLALRSRVSLDNDTYLRAKQELIEAGVVVVGRGRGGTLARIDEQRTDLVAARAAPKGVEREVALYDPFVEWVRASLEGLEEEGPAFHHVVDTSGWRRPKKAGSKWAQPDVIAVTVANYDWLPGASVEVSSYEIKRATDAVKLEWVYEAAAHRRWAHRASLVVESFEGSGPVSESVRSELDRLGLGLYAMDHNTQGDGFAIREVLQPRSIDPDSENIDELLSHFFAREKAMAQPYKFAIRG